MVRRFIRRVEKGEPGGQPGPTKAAEEARLKILEMLGSGKITAEQALKLLEVVEPKPPTTVGIPPGAAAFAFTTQADSQVESFPDGDEIVKTISSAGIDLVRVENPNGRITVVGWDKPEIQVTARRVSGERTHAGVAVHQEDATLVIKAGNPTGIGHGFFPMGAMFERGHHTSVALEVSVPADMDTKMWSANAAVFAEGLAGETKVTTVNGSIHCSNISGGLKAGTTNGAIDLRELRTDDTRVKTVNGRILVALTETRKGECTAGTVNGSPMIDGP